MDNILFVAASIVTIIPRYVVLEFIQTDFAFPFSNETKLICDNNTRITVYNVSVLADAQCGLNTRDVNVIKTICDGKESCLVKPDLTSGCLVEYGYFSLAYDCRVPDYNCNFEIGFCDWFQDESDDFNWTIQLASTQLYGPVPYTDHTTVSKYGHLLHAGKSSRNNIPNVGNKARLISNTVLSNGYQCLTFWYQMHGTNKGILNVYQQTERTLRTPIVTLSFGTGHVWVRSDIPLSKYPSFKIVFESVQGGSDSSIALDDIKIREGLCSASMYECSFEENNLCGWFIESVGLQWTLIRPHDYPSTSIPYPYYDHTQMTGNGRYLRAYIQNQNPIKITRLIRNDYYSTVDTCLTFWYNIAYNDVGILRVTVNSLNGSYTTLWTTSKKTSQIWLQTNIDITASETNGSSIAIECISQQGSDIIVAIDDIILRPRKCSGYKRYERRYNSSVDVVHISDCPKPFLDLNNFSITYHPTYNNCLSLYEETEAVAWKMCDNLNGTDLEYCNVSLSAIKERNIYCFLMEKYISVDYICGAYSNGSVAEREKADSFKIIGIGIGAGSALVILIIITICIVKRRTQYRDQKETKRTNPNSGGRGTSTGRHESVNNTDMEVVYYNEQHQEQVNFTMMSKLRDESKIHLGLDKDNLQDIVYYNLNTKVTDIMANQNSSDIHESDIEESTDISTDNAEGVYDRTNSLQYKRGSEEHNMYSNVVDDVYDSVYDSAIQSRIPQHVDDVSYDHFISGTSENEYSVVNKN